jgi:hypothetical protein
VLHSSALQDSNEYLFNKEPASSTRKGKVSDVLKKKTEQYLQVGHLKTKI